MYTHLYYIRLIEYLLAANAAVCTCVSDAMPSCSVFGLRPCCMNAEFQVRSCSMTLLRVIIGCISILGLVHVLTSGALETCSKEPDWHC